jgi:hypothetical protein
MICQKALSGLPVNRLQQTQIEPRLTAKSRHGGFDQCPTCEQMATEQQRALSIQSLLLDYQIVC